jgi:hypothetical protein
VFFLTRRSSVDTHLTKAHQDSAKAHAQDGGAVEQMQHLRNGIRMKHA